MVQTSHTFRIFVSSTFSDLKEERNALQQRVFPRLRELCLRHGARFQAIDLRWGVSEEAGRDQRTMQICLDEIGRCQRATPRPNFIMLLGDRYGWRPLPAEIPTDEFEEITRRITDSAEKALLIWEEAQPAEQKGWYRRDDNAVPPVYHLQPRTKDFFDDYQAWEKQVERPLREILFRITAGMQLTHEQRLKYSASATELEIVRGALQVPDARQHVFGFFRQVENRQDLLRDLPRDYLDLDEDEKPDHNAQQRLQELKERLEQALPGNIQTYQSSWTGKGLSTDHIGALCVDAWWRLARAILKEIKGFEQVKPLDKEIADHAAFGRERARFFTGRARALEAIRAYVRDSDAHPVALWGASGSGKSALMARAAEQIRGELPGAELVVRFIGATPETSNARALLESLCHDISRRYGADQGSIPSDYKELVDEFPKRLALARADRPLVLLLDALDQLSDTDNAHSLLWLPADLPAHVRLIVSSLAQDARNLPTDCFSALEGKLPTSSLFELEPFSREEGGRLLDLWLRESRRTLQREQRAAVLNQFARNGLPLFLKLAFEEARLWRSYDGVRELGTDIPDIVGNLFKRLSNETNHGGMLVSHSLGYLAAARNGLSEDEILDVLSRDTDVMQDFQRRSPKSPQADRLPVVVWSRLYFDLEPYLAERSADGTALLAFYHRELNEVAKAQYLAGEAGRERPLGLADFFYATVTNESHPTAHALVEAPYQLARAGEKERLVHLLTDITYLDNRCSSTDAYNLVQDYTDCTSDLPELFEEVKPYQAFIRKHAQRLGDYPNLLFSLVWLEGFPEAKTRAEQLVDLWRKPWLRTTPARMPPAKETGSARDMVETLARLQYETCVVSGLAAERQLAFLHKRRGKIGLIDLKTGREFPEQVTIRGLRPLAIFCSQDGQHLAVAYENAEADLMHLNYSQQGALLHYTAAKVFDFLRPRFELPKMEFIGENLWFQNKDGSISCLPLEIGEASIPFMGLESESSKGELSGIVALDNHVVITLRQAADTLMISLSDIHHPSFMKFPNVDVNCICAIGPERVAVAFTDQILHVFAVAGGLQPVHEIRLEELPARMVGNGGLLFWISETGGAYEWMVDKELEPRKVDQNGEDLLYARQLAQANDGTLTAVTPNLALRFIISGSEKKAAQKTQAVFTVGGSDNYWAIQRRGKSMWLLDGGAQAEVGLLEETDYSYSFALDGTNHLLGAGIIGNGFVMNVSDYTAEPVKNLPSGIMSVAGNRSGGFWLTNDLGEIYFIDPSFSTSIARVAQFEASEVGRSYLHAWHGLVVWSGAVHGSDSAQVVRIFRPNETKRGALREVSRKSHEYSERFFQTAAFDPTSDRLVLIWFDSASETPMVEAGTPQQFLEHQERTTTLDGVDHQLVDAALLSDGSDLALLSEQGNLFLLDGQTFRARAVLAGSIPIARFAQDNQPGSSLLLSIGDEQLTFCRFKKEKTT